jgi:ATP-binding cassette subfamily B protein
MSLGLADVGWPLARVGEAVEALGHAARLSLSTPALEVPSPPPDLEHDGALSRWIETTAAWLSLEAEPVNVPYVEVPSLVRGSGPALLKIAAGGNVVFILLLRGGKRTVTVVDATRTERQLPAELLTSALRRSLDATVEGEIDRTLERTVPTKRRRRARAALLEARVGARWIAGCWLLRGPATSSLAYVARRARLPRLLGWMVAAHAVAYALMLLSWWAVTQGAFQGRFDTGALIAWLLLLTTLVPFQLLSARCGSHLAIRSGTLLKTRLLSGALRLDPSVIRHQGAGQLLGRVIESSAVETLGLSGGLASLVAIVELVACLLILGKGVGGSLHVVLLLLMAFITGICGLRYFARRKTWTEVRLSMTHDLVERMVGHRTRIAQEPRARWHDGEDQVLERYVVASASLDRATMALALIPRAWLFLGIGGLLPSLLASNPGVAPLALSLGGVVLAHRALQSLTNGGASIAGAVIGWSQASPLVRAARSLEVAPPPTAAIIGAARTPVGSLLLDAQDLRFRFRGRAEPVLRGCSLRVRLGDRLLLEGPSGGGKSTFGSLLTGLRVPESGLLLLNGLDRHTLGSEAWRRRVVAAPQFHENHVFGATFAFNLLMGRAWPPGPGDLEEAEKICRELDLGPLLDRMPGGLQQMVGETGWQLSHGEKSRLYIARALLQDADLLVLDESFAALDPETLHNALACVLKRSRTLLVIAHP